MPDFSSEFKTQIEEADRYVNPDATAVCGKVDQSDETVGAITNPVLVIEVVSDSSESYDRGQKYRYYRRLPSVKEYLLLEQKSQVLHSIGETETVIYLHALILKGQKPSLTYRVWTSNFHFQPFTVT